MADAARTEGLSATDVASPGFTAPALAAERVLRYRLTVTGKGAQTSGNVDRHRASDTVTVTVRAAPTVTAVALTSAPRADATYRSGETIEVSVTFSAPVTVTGPPTMTPTIGLEVGTETRPAAYTRNAGPAVLLFSYTVTADDRDDDGVAVPADGIALAGGTIAGSHGVAIARPRCGGGGRGAYGQWLDGGADGRGVRPHAAGARRAGGEGEGEQTGGDGLLTGYYGGYGRPRRDHRHAAARGPGHCGPEGRGLRRPGQADGSRPVGQRADGDCRRRCSSR